MKAEKLTLRECFLYPKARIIFKRDNEQWTDVESFVYDYYSIDEPTFSINDCLLQLRPLSRLTEYEHYELKNIIISDTDNDIEINHDYFKYLYSAHKKALDYLRSINIDIDGLQERGIAVYE